MKRGSALLIVLGMLAFMVTSAIGFSIYMRESRVPSSYLRRESTARYLMKSALANAIARLDGEIDPQGRLWGICDDVYPGVTSRPLDNQNGNRWSHRVFTPFGEVPQNETVPVLTLEALAYLPPAIINEVRIWSRLSAAATWQNLSYDLGRFAFCAVDVSDCFDINRVRAGKRRSSAAGERVNLSSLYPDDGSKLDQLFNRAGNVPFVSMADFNVAAGRSDYSPFMKFIGSSGQPLYTTEDADALSNALFIADSWFPATNDWLNANLELKKGTTGATVYDLALGTSGSDGDRKAAQPFVNYKVTDFLHVSDQTPVTKQGGLFLGNLGGVGLACLYDYLDGNSVPVTLALPTVETAPMVCGFSIVNAGGGLNPKFRLDGTTVKEFLYTRNEADGQAHTFRRTIKRYVFKGASGYQQSAVSGTVLYPFKRLPATGRDKTFTVETLVGLFYADAGMRARVKGNAFRPTKDIWTNPGTVDGVSWFKGTSQQLTQTDNLCGDDAEQKAVLPFVIRMENPPAKDQNVCYLVHDEDITQQDENGQPARITHADILTTDGLKNDNDRFRPFKTDGEEDASVFGEKPLYGAADLANNEQDPANASSAYRLHYAVWLRVVDGDSKTVDLVPAVFADDETWIDGCKYGALAENQQLTALCGADKPILAFRADSTTEFKYDKAVIEALDGSKEAVFENFKALYAPDPRYNFAPEDWKGVATAYNSPEDWRNNTMGSRSAADCDKDIFMFTSDQEYLQSIGELQFLPFVQRLGRNTSFLSCDFADANYDGVVGSGANSARYWKSYSAIADNDEERNPFFDLMDNGRPVSVISGSGDFRVNPFSPDPRILESAIIDTPYDYYIASTNDDCNPKANMPPSTAQDLAFGPDGTCDRWDEIDCGNIAGRLRDEFLAEARNGRSDITEALSNLAWQDASNRKRIFNLNEDLENPLHDVDRKFLFSFWRECFQNRQHLFLVFIRAEPLTVGGSTGDAIANAQLGARGVAVVWRDPAPPPKASGVQQMTDSNGTSWRDRQRQNGPHRTRVLFYHQFD